MIRNNIVTWILGFDLFYLYHFQIPKGGGVASHTANPLDRASNFLKISIPYFVAPLLTSPTPKNGTKVSNVTTAARNAMRKAESPKLEHLHRPKEGASKVILEIFYLIREYPFIDDYTFLRLFLM